MNLPTLAGPQATLLGASPTLLGMASIYPAPNLYGLGETPDAPAVNNQSTDESSAGLTGVQIAWILARLAGGAAGTYHGYRRNQSVPWALWWGLMGSSFPIITTGISLAQGFGKEK